MKMKNREKFLQKTIVVWLGALICCFLWGSAFPGIKLGYQLFQISSSDTASQILFAGYRFTLAGIFAILLGSILSRKLLTPSKNSLPKIFKLCLLQTVAQYVFFYVGLAHTSGVKASIIEAMNVFIAIIVASLLFHQETLSIKKIVGCIIGFTGVVLINLSGNGINLNFSLLGDGFILFSTVAYAFSSVCLKRYSKSENPVMLSGYQFICGGLIMIFFGYIMGGNITHFPPSSMKILLYLALVSAVAYSLWGILLKYNPVSRVSVFGFMNPVFGVILSAIFLGEAEQAFGVASLVSLVLVCLGIYIVNK